jgi:hypothetical protein
MATRKEGAAPEWRRIIAERIETEDYSYNALGKEAGVSPSVVWRYVKVGRDVRAATLEKLCAALDLVLVPRELVRDEPA